MLPSMILQGRFRRGRHGSRGGLAGSAAATPTALHRRSTQPPHAPPRRSYRRACSTTEAQTDASLGKISSANYQHSLPHLFLKRLIKRAQDSSQGRPSLISG